MQLLTRTVRTAIIGLLAFGLLIFAPAGTLDYWQGWTFLLVFGLLTISIGLYLALANPALLERRIRAGPIAETRLAQKIIITMAFTAFCLMLIVSSLDHRFGWSQSPAWLSVIGNTLVAFGLMIDLRVFRENSYGASTIEKMEGQEVIVTGPYAVVRHPMYVGVLIMTLGTPLALGSWWGALFVTATIPILMLRILDEETMLREELMGYEAYTRNVRYRLLPGVW
ncbi:methyltransferase family protein [Bosea vestrisii]|uniref:Methyltransferase family protein n=1 Tax=Bosea vestrisii TaxID=151416 RepID=A0ABW0HJM4_9HYPH